MKIWTVTIEVQGLVVAEDESEACESASSIVDDGGPRDCATAFEWKPKHSLPSGWDMDTILYASDKAIESGVDRTVQEWADELFPPDPERCTRTIDLFGETADV